MLTQNQNKIIHFNANVISKHATRLSELEKKIKEPEQSLLSAPLSPPLSR